MRTLKQFEAAFNQVKWFVNFHKKPVWLIATDNDYALSIIKPSPDDFACGTVANLYDVNLDIIDSVMNTTNPWK